MLFKLSKHKPKTENSMKGAYPEKQSTEIIWKLGKNTTKNPQNRNNNHERRTKNRLLKTDFKNPSEHNTPL